ncbi:xyloglucan endotransglucosylase/hydrolase protein 2-like [Syzygium oleosum]|uniref:xyloglucan endotransglucosylase/hydrolase protein 2-like n=1 Tax=Syzygium oleosum TaxID=219896 RepID=UPI0024B8F6F0|nr:xyloglucan endotransglucosylase/hydrolase protein 2-like [Syzygium oleosum]
MESYLLSGFLGFVMVNMLFACGRRQVTFSRNYNIIWGNDHFSSLNGDTKVELTLNQSSGAGFQSKSRLLSGLFNMRIKIPHSKSPGVVTSFYLTSTEAQHDEIDFEFIGSNGPPYKLSTNVFTKGVGNREQIFRLWFDPSTDFHSYTILQNQYQVVFFVDDIPLRVFKNLGNEANYPTQGMLVEATIWHAEGWAGKIDWSKGPFKAQYQGFDIDGCVVSDPSNPGKCDYTHGDAWAQNQTLNAAQIAQYQNAKRKYLDYDYCTDKTRHPQTPPECQAPI